MEIHGKFIQSCTSRLQQSADFLTKVAEHSTDCKTEIKKDEIRHEAIKIVRCLTVLKEYVAECDDDHVEERVILPHGRLVF